MAANTDKLKKLARRWVGQIGSAGVSDASVTTIPLSSTTNLPNDTAVTLVIDRVSANGTATPALEETIVGVVSGSNIINAIRGVEGTAQAHSAGAVVEVLWTANNWNDAVDWGLVEHNQDGTHSNITACDISLSGTKTINTVRDEDNMASNSDTSLATQQSIKAYVDTNVANIITPTNNQYSMFNNSMSRQAIINGNFDVWQRGTSFSSSPLASGTFTSDRWKSGGTGPDGGTNPTITISRQTFSSGELANSFYFWRMNTNGAGSGFGTNSFQQISQRIEHGTRLLCGDGKKVTLSFYARSDIANRRIGVALTQHYGSGGSPSSAEQIITQEPITLTSSLTKYVCTFETNTLSGKTFGTNNDDYLDVRFILQWEASAGNTYVYPDVSAQNFGGSGNVDIAQVQLCAGDVALPFQPKSFAEELVACMRYFEKSYDYSVAPGTANTYGYYILSSRMNNYVDTSNIRTVGNIIYKVQKRVAPTLTIYSLAGTKDKWTFYPDNVEVTTLPDSDQKNDKMIAFRGAFGGVSGWTDGSSDVCLFHYTLDAEL